MYLPHLYLPIKQLDEHGGLSVGLRAANEDGVGRQQPSGGQRARLQASRPHLPQRARDLPRRELHRPAARLNTILTYTSWI